MLLFRWTRFCRSLSSFPLNRRFCRRVLRRCPQFLPLICCFLGNRFVLRLDGALAEDARLLLTTFLRSRERLGWCDLNIHDLFAVTVRSESLLAESLKGVICNRHRLSLEGLVCTSEPATLKAFDGWFAHERLETFCVIRTL